MACSDSKLRMSVPVIVYGWGLGPSNETQEKCDEIPRAMEPRICPYDFDNNGRFLALLTPDGRLKVWTCTNGSLKHEFTPSSHLATTCTCLKWSVSSRVLDTPRKKKQKVLRHSENLESTLIALGTSTGSVLLYSIATGEVIQNLEGGHEDRVNGLSWHDEDGLLYSCSEDKHITEWRTDGTQKKCKWKADKHAVKCIRVCSRSNSLLSAGRSIKLWDLETKEVLKKFTGHATPVSQLLVIPGHGYPDSNANHISNGSTKGFYFLSGAEQDRLLNIWSTNSECGGKNALVSMSLTEGPVSTDIARHNSSDKPLHVAAVTRDGQLHVFEQTLNGGGRKPLTPARCIQLASSGTKGSSPSPIPILAVRMTADKEPSILIAFGSAAKPSFEVLSYSSMEPQTCLIREDTSGLLLRDTSSTGTQERGAEAAQKEVTVLGPTNMVLPTQSVAKEDGKRKKGKGQPAEGIATEQTMEDRLKDLTSAQQREPRNGPPTASSLAQMLIQALHSQDNSLMESVLSSSSKEAIVRNTVKRLPVTLVLPFLTEIVQKIQVSPGRGSHLVIWIKSAMSIHMSYLMTIPNLVETLSGLYSMMEARVGVFGKLCKLQGRLDLMLSQVAAQSHAVADEEDLAQPLAVYQEESDDELHLEEEMALEAGHSESEENWDEEEMEKEISEDEKMDSDEKSEEDEEEDDSESEEES